jgi:hypothetical protein
MQALCVYSLARTRSTQTRTCTYMKPCAGSSTVFHKKHPLSMHEHTVGSILLTFGTAECLHHRLVPGKYEHFNS